VLLDLLNGREAGEQCVQAGFDPLKLFGQIAEVLDQGGYQADEITLGVLASMITLIIKRHIDAELLDLAPGVSPCKM
jgi:hypothetical protein